MSFLQNALEWIAEQAFPIVFIFCCVVIAYMVYAAAFRKRVLPDLLNRRVKELLLTPSGSRPAVTASGSRPASTTSGIRPPATAQAQPREASPPQPGSKRL